MSQYAEIKCLDISTFEKVSSARYKDEGIVVLSGEDELKLISGPARVDIFILFVCTEGKFQVNVNMSTIVVSERNVLLCKPNDLIDENVFFPGFQGYVLCLSPQIIRECVPGDGLWKQAFRHRDKSVIQVSPETFKVLALYGDLLCLKTRAESRRSRGREAVLSIIRSLQCELLDELDECYAVDDEQQRQRDVLFRNFIDLLIGGKVKSRAVSWYSDRLFVTPKHLSTMCKLVSGRTAGDWIKEYVLMDIRFQLKYSDKSIKEISEMMNFPNLSFFAKYVRTNLGDSPTELRKKLRERK